MLKQVPALSRCGVHDLKVNLTAPGFGEVLLDGKPIAVSELTFHAAVGELNTVTLRLPIDKADITSACVDVTRLGMSVREYRATKPKSCGYPNEYFAGALNG